MVPELFVPASSQTSVGSILCLPPTYSQGIELAIKWRLVANTTAMSSYAVLLDISRPVSV